MPANPVNPGAVLTGELSALFWLTYDRMSPLFARLTEIMMPTITYDRELTEIKSFGYPKSANHFQHWAAGNPVEFGTFGWDQFSARGFRFGAAAQWDRLNELWQNRMMLRRAIERIGRNSALVLPRIVNQFIEGSAAGPVPIVPNALDGAALYSATDGAGGDRGGVSGGNIVTGAGVTAADIEADFFGKVIPRLRRFVDTTAEAQPYWQPEEIDLGIAVVIPPDVESAWREVIGVARSLRSDGAGGAAAVSPKIDAYGFTIELIVSSRLTGTSDWYSTLTGIPDWLKPMFVIVDAELQEFLGDMTNSDQARKEQLLSLVWDLVLTPGVGNPLSTIKCDNS